MALTNPTQRRTIPGVKTAEESAVVVDAGV